MLGETRNEVNAYAGYFARPLALLVVMVCGLAGFAAHAAEETASKADQQCLGCHSNKGLEKKLPNGETLSLHIDEPAFARSAHNVLGCSVCHGDVTIESPAAQERIKSVRGELARNGGVSAAIATAMCSSVMRQACTPALLPGGQPGCTVLH